MSVSGGPHRPGVVRHKRIIGSRGPSASVEATISAPPPPPVDVLFPLAVASNSFSVAPTLFGGTGIPYYYPHSFPNWTPSDQITFFDLYNSPQISICSPTAAGPSDYLTVGSVVGVSVPPEGLLGQANPASRAWASVLVWSPDASHYLQVNTPDVGGTYVVLLDGTTPISGVGGGGAAVPISSQPWSPDGSHIVYCDTSVSHAYTIPVGGGTPTRIDAASVFNHRTAAWSPDGNTICVAGTGEIGLVNPDGTNYRTIFPTNRYTVSPKRWGSNGPFSVCWSPGGDRLAFYNGQGICFIDADGGNPFLAWQEGNSTWLDWCKGAGPADGGVVVTHTVVPSGMNIIRLTADRHATNYLVG